MRVIFDANVFVSAAIQRGAPHRIVQDWLNSGTPDVIACPTLISEIEEVLTLRPKLRRWITMDEGRDFVETVGTLVNLKSEPLQVAAIFRDASDDYLIALANEQAVQFIVSGDKDLLEWAGDKPAITSPTAFEVIKRLFEYGNE